ncbi:YqaA family protein [Marinobacter fonticola]|uniref:YqaA family protein n=1 Tax=Marinobacter fonticola TaxID=2603215 RepID=UPI0011E6E5C8|nr:VTT domain-containing protein [Marinobacter fonticola]
MSDGSEKAGYVRRQLNRLRRLIDRLIYSRHMLWGVGIASFLESIIVPIPLEAILIPLMQARRSAMIAISTAALLGCLVGASVGYAVGYFVFDAIGPQLVSLIASQQQYEQVRQQMESQGFWFVLSVGVVPIPFQIAMLAAGATKYSFALFIAASVLARAVRYYGLAALVWLAGNQAQALFERHKLPVALGLTAVVAAVWGLSLL